MGDLAGFVQKIISNMEQVIVGKKEIIKLILVSLLCRGHLLLEDVPGMGKTMMVRALAKSLGCSFNRIQFTPDLLPSDVTGVWIFNQKNSEFEFRSGPVMAQLILADEINRASPKTQASLLECMEEGQITVDGVTHRLPRPFLVLATQNPMEHHGTFPLPEAQMDRFIMRTNLGYPSYEEEIFILQRLEQRHPIEAIKQVVDAEELIMMQEKVQEVLVDAAILDYIVRIVLATRNHHEVVLGASPRGSLSLLRTAKAFAAIEGRNYVLPDDVKSLAQATLAHRIVLRPEALYRGCTQERVVAEVLENAEIPI
ncbi:MAG: MoxR family ATPase [Clostridia bacterium]|nr:MoxR family ATPase [Clostridia bacterium]